MGEKLINKYRHEIRLSEGRGWRGTEGCRLRIMKDLGVKAGAMGSAKALTWEREQRRGKVTECREVRRQWGGQLMLDFVGQGNIQVQSLPLVLCDLGYVPLALWALSSQMASEGLASSSQL